MSLALTQIIRFLESLADPHLAEDWDNVGLLLGDAESSIKSVMTCLTLTPDVAAEAVNKQAGLVITHHPILFRAVKRLTTATLEGRMLLELIRSGVAVYSPHTAFDNGQGGINQWLAEELGLKNIAPLRPLGDDPACGSGRWGELVPALSWPDFQRHLASKLGLPQFQVVDAGRGTIQRVAIACGAAAEYLPDAHQNGCEAFITGEARFHSCLESKALGVNLALLGHYSSERPALEMLARRLAQEFPALNAWASETERDPLTWFTSAEV